MERPHHPDYDESHWHRKHPRPLRPNEDESPESTGLPANPTTDELSAPSANDEPTWRL